MSKMWQTKGIRTGAVHLRILLRKDQQEENEKMRVKNILIGKDTDFRSRGNDVKMGFMTRKNRFDETSRNWRSNAGYIGIAKTILRGVLGFIIAVLGGIIVDIDLAILGSILAAVVTMLRTADFLRDNTII